MSAMKEGMTKLRLAPENIGGGERSGQAEDEPNTCDIWEAAAECGGEQTGVNFGCRQKQIGRVGWLGSSICAAMKQQNKIAAATGEKDSHFLPGHVRGNKF